MTNKILNTADPTIAPIPALDSLTKIPINDMKTSGAELPAAIKVAPATSWSKFNFLRKFKLKLKIFLRINNFGE